MRRSSSFILFAMMAMLVVAYWIGDVSRDIYQPYASTNLAPVEYAELVVPPTEASSVFLLLRGTLRELCGEIGTPQILQIGDHTTMRVPLQKQQPCEEETTYEAQIPLDASFLRSPPQFVTVNSYTFEVEAVGRVASAVRFAYDETTYADYPAPTAVQGAKKAPLDASMMNLTEEQITNLETRYQEQAINFAGRFVLLQATCTTDIVPDFECRHYSVIDPASGKIVDSVEYEGLPAGYRQDSRLFVTNDPLGRSSAATEKITFYVLEDGVIPQLRQIAVSPRGAYTETSTSSSTIEN